MDEAVSEARGSLLHARSVVWALRVTALAVLAAVGATQYLARVSEPTRTVSVARGPGVTDPETTGSIRAARQVRLDPCALSR